MLYIVNLRCDAHEGSISIMRQIVLVRWPRAMQKVNILGRFIVRTLWVFSNNLSSRMVCLVSSWCNSDITRHSLKLNLAHFKAKQIKISYLLLKLFVALVVEDAEFWLLEEVCDTRLGEHCRLAPLLVSLRLDVPLLNKLKLAIVLAALSGNVCCVWK